MEKFKICPYCGTKNLPTALECDSCETDLSTVRVTDEETSKRRENDESLSPSAPPMMRVRVCESCGFANPANARKCSSCGEDISDVIPTETSPEEEKHYVLASLDGEYAFQLPVGDTTIGREAVMSEYLVRKSFVSRQHAQLELRDGRLILKNLSRTNYTFVNNQKASDDAVELKDGDIIGLGGNEQNGKRQDNAAYFMVRIGSCM